MSNTESNINVSVTFRHTEATQALKQHAVQKITNVAKKFLISDADIAVILSVEKRDHVAEVSVKSRRFNITSKAVEPDLYVAVDRMADTLETQFRKAKEKLVGHK